MSALPAPIMITTVAGLRGYAETWASEPLLALDTESNSLYTYREQVCLLQLSTRKADYIIDPLAFDDLSPLAPLLANSQIEKVFHAAEYDLMSLKRDFGFAFAGLFDTMIAARICGEERVGLGSMLDEHFGVKANKRFQRANWGDRPLKPELLRYAQLDTHFLPELRDYWRERLETDGHWQEAAEVFSHLSDIVPVERKFDPDGFWRISDKHDLLPKQMSLVRELYLFREKIAKQRNYPPFKVFTDKTLAALAVSAPRDNRALSHISGMTSGQIRRYGRGILKAINRGRECRPPSRPRNRRPGADVLARYEALKNWRKKRARNRGVESDVIAPREALWALAYRSPTSLEDLNDVPGLGPWKVETYGEEILRVLARVNGRR